MIHRNTNWSSQKLLNHFAGVGQSSMACLGFAVPAKPGMVRRLPTRHPVDRSPPDRLAEGSRITRGGTVFRG